MSIELDYTIQNITSVTHISTETSVILKASKGWPKAKGFDHWNHNSSKYDFNGFDPSKLYQDRWLRIISVQYFVALITIKSLKKTNEKEKWIWLENYVRVDIDLLAVKIFNEFFFQNKHI